jgi:hypothetical protein
MPIGAHRHRVGRRTLVGLIDIVLKDIRLKYRRHLLLCLSESRLQRSDYLALFQYDNA